MLGKLAGSPLWVVADKAYASEMGRALMWGIGAWPAIPAKRDEAAVRWPAWVHKRAPPRSCHGSAQDLVSVLLAMRESPAQDVLTFLRSAMLADLVGTAALTSSCRSAC